VRGGKKGFDKERFLGVLESQQMTYLGYVQVNLYISIYIFNILRIIVYIYIYVYISIYVILTHRRQ
jgi:hypothetical protein